MRTLSATLTTAQKAPAKPLYKIDLTKTGANSYTYTGSRILNLEHVEEQDSASAQILLNNSDTVLTNLDLTGYTCTISYGLTTTAGEEYSACAPLRAITQQPFSARGTLVCYLECVGYFNLMREDKASDNFEGLATDTDTLKTRFNAVAQATLSVFNHCDAYTVDWDSEDSIVDVYQPGDLFTISRNESRFSVLEGLLELTECVMRIGADGDIHVFVPTTE